MARIRTIKPEFPQSESMGRVSRDARLLFIQLWTLCDDEGRSRGDARLLKGLLYPYDEVRFSEIDGWLDELEREGCLTRYEAEGSRYLAIRNWLNHQKIDRPTPSKLPPPREDYETTREDSRESADFSSLDLDLDLDREGKGSGPGPSASRASSRAARGCRVPDPFEVTPEMRAWAATETPSLDLESATREFCDYWRAVPGQRGVKLDWVATWRNRMREVASRQKPQRVNGAARVTRYEQSRQALMAASGMNAEELDAPI